MSESVEKKSRLEMAKRKICISRESIQTSIDCISKLSVNLGYMSTIDEDGGEPEASDNIGALGLMESELDILTEIVDKLANAVSNLQSLNIA